jgi:hypothetical protein
MGPIHSCLIFSKVHHPTVQKDSFGLGYKAQKAPCLSWDPRWEYMTKKHKINSFLT